MNDALASGLIKLRFDGWSRFWLRTDRLFEDGLQTGLHGEITQGATLGLALPFERCFDVRQRSTPENMKWPARRADTR